MAIYPSGTRIANRYEVVQGPREKPGLAGGMGIVYLCVDHQEDRPVALKTFQSKFLPDRTSRDRFLREGTTWVNLGSHPHIVRAYGVKRIGDGREVYLVLEWVTKEERRQDASLRSWLTQGKPLPVEQALLFALQIARGMGHATAVIPGLVHRDLKPANILVGNDRLSNTETNRLRVTDFGLARVLAAGETLPPVGEGEPLPERPGLTQVGRVVGTPDYMAPELWERTDVDLRTDIYALGCILGEMLTGQVLVRERTLRAFRQAHQGGRAREAVMGLPAKLAALLAYYLAVNPEERHASWEQVEAALVAAYEEVVDYPAPEPEAAAALSRAERVAVGWSYNAMGGSYLDIGKAEVAREYFERARDIGQVEGENHLESSGLASLGMAYNKLGDAVQAVQFCEQALVISRKIGDRRTESAAMSHMGTAYVNLGDAKKAIRFYEQALAIDREIGERQWEGTTLGSLGTVYRELGDVRRAIEYYKQQLVIAREIGNQREEGNSLGNLGNAYFQLGKVQQAIKFHNLALSISRAIGDRSGEGTSLGNLGSAYTVLGKMKQAMGFYEQKQKISREIGNRHGEGLDLINLGAVHFQLGDPQRAIRFFEQALAIAREIGNRRGEEQALANLGSSYGLLGETQRAIEFFEQNLEIVREIGDRNGEGIVLGNLGNAHLNLGDAQRAIEFFDRQLVITREIGDRRGEGNTLMNLGVANKMLRNTHRAVEYLEQALEITSEISDRHGEARILGKLGLAYAALGNMQQSIGFHERALAIAREVSDAHEIATQSFHIARLYAQKGQLNQALSLAQQATEIWESMGNPNVQIVRQLIAQIQAATHLQDTQVDPAQRAFELLQRTKCLADVQNAVAQFPFMTDPGFITGVAQTIAQQVPSEHRSAFEQRLAWLHQTANNLAFKAFQKSGSFDRMQHAVEKFPLMTGINFIAGVEQVLAQQVTPEDKPAFEQRLTWLRQIANNLAFKAFQESGSPDRMQHAVEKLPLMTSADFIAGVEQILAQQVVPEDKPAFEQRLTWLRRIAGEQK
jgi:tetratricopeptide (TPR) repeat protein